MAKPKLNVKELLLKKGEYIAFGVAGVGLLLLLVMGASTWAGAEDPAKLANDLKTETGQVHRSIANNTADPEPLPTWAQAGKKSDYPHVSVKEFPQSGVLFDPTAKPDTKRDNPSVVGIDEYQVDLIRAPMKGNDIIYDNDGNGRIAVRVVSKIGEQDKARIKTAMDQVRNKSNKVRQIYKDNSRLAAPKGPIAGIGTMPGPGVMPGPMGRPMPGPGSSSMPGPGSSSSGPMPGPGSSSTSYPMAGYGMGGSGYDASAQRTETSIVYIPIEDVDKAALENKLPAMTVIPLRMAVINATLNLKDQTKEMMRALRLQDSIQAAKYIQFDGFEVKRRITKVQPTGEAIEVQGWAEYKYEDKYVELIGSRKLSDYFEKADATNPKAAYLPYFYRYEDALVMPLPELVPELGTYPTLRLNSINTTIDRMIKEQTPPETPSALLERIKGKTRGKENFVPVDAGTGGAAGIYGKAGFSGPIVDPMRPGATPKAIDPKNPMGATAAPPVEIDHLLLRFIDCDVKPGFTYEYQFRVRMMNPNFGNPDFMTNPRLATEEQYRVLTSPWKQLTESLTVPTESFLFAGDPATYQRHVEDAYRDQPALRNRMKLKENQTVVEAAAWLEQVKTDTGTAREPVGAWVVADMPVGRGEYVGKKTYVKLPLWSSESNQYILRELAAEKTGKGKVATAPPKGWLVDFTSRSVLVDFEGGKTSGRSVSEDVDTEMLIVRPDGKLQVRSTATDAANEERKKLIEGWEAWTKQVESRPAAGAGGPTNQFERPK